MRYYSDPRRRAVATQIQAEVLRAAEVQKLGGWITYLIRDPRYPDHRGNGAGMPIYIGQSKEFPKRVLKRFMSSEKLARKKDSIERRVTDLLHADVVVRYEALERMPTRLSSLVSETNWIKRCRNAGYDLCNNLEEQRFGGPPIDRYGIPETRLAPFLLEEAIQDQVDIMVSCSTCGFALVVDLARVRACPGSPTTIGAVKRSLDAMPCTSCTEGRWLARLAAR